MNGVFRFHPGYFRRGIRVFTMYPPPVGKFRKRMSVFFLNSGFPCFPVAQDFLFRERTPVER